MVGKKPNSGNVFVKWKATFRNNQIDIKRH